jgi:hypothetical protein
MDEDTISKALQYDSEHVDTYWLWQLRIINGIVICCKKFPLRKQIARKPPAVFTPPFKLSDLIR